MRMDEGDSSASNVTDTLLPEVAVIGVSLAATLARLAEGLVVRPDAMRRNLALTQGLIASEAAMMRLAETIGRHEAHHLLYEAAQRSIDEQLPFIDAIRAHPLLQGRELPADFAAALDPERYVGQSVALAEETVARTARAAA